MGKKCFSAEERQFLGRLQSQLAAVESLGLPSLISLLAIARNEGLSVTDLAEETGLPQQSVSRYVSMLLGRYQLEAMSDSPIALIEQRINPADPRKRALFLTDSGRETIMGVLDISSAFKADERA
jgi:DNA-binding MarR family transcriptional regulator